MLLFLDAFKDVILDSCTKYRELRAGKVRCNRPYRLQCADYQVILAEEQLLLRR